MTDTTLISRLTNPDPKIRQQAFFELKKLEKAQALEVLIESLTNDDPTILEELYQKIREIAPNHLSVLVKKLKHPNLKIRAELVKLLREVGNNTISAELVNLLLEPPEIRACAIEALGYIKDPWSLNYIRDFIFDRSAEVRIATAKALGYFEDRESADQLLRLLTDPETNVRLAAIEALAMIKEARAGEHLWELSLNDPNDEVRRRALWALKTIGDTTIKSYEKNLGSDDIELRNQTIAELVRYGKVMLFPMLNLTYHPTPQVRELAVKVLGELKEPAAVTRLIELANDFSPEVRQSALGALGKIKSEEAIRFLAQELENPNPQIADTAKELLSSIGKNSVKILLELLPNSTTETQLKIIEIIGKMGAHELLDVIKEKLNDPRVWVRRALCEALSNFRHPEVA
ncbi:MAG: HEAT repeat domain-containing protein, partial [candidate division WOR-3 bacterium]|nr:HEAT repeat domain-containing protein [candidate division WOR-3 bacterium]